MAMSVELENCSPSRSVTYKNYSALAGREPEAALSKLRRVTRENINNTLRLLRHNVANSVFVYRFSSKMVPLATHPALADWDYPGDLGGDLRRLGELVREHNMRVSFHPDHFSVLNTPKEDVFASSVKDFLHHCTLLEKMGLDHGAKLITHVGGAYGNKMKSRDLFRDNWPKVPESIKKRLALENDDKTFTAEDVLYLCEQLALPMVLDIHHYFCNREEHSDLREVCSRFMQTWQNTGLPPKIHVSSPRSPTDIRSHNDWVNPEDVYPFIKIMLETGRDFDAMVEAKRKDEAMFRLVKELGAYPGIKQINEATLEVA